MMAAQGNNGGQTTPKTQKSSVLRLGTRQVKDDSPVMLFS